jgi:thiamine-monophosphate kinase
MQDWDLRRAGEFGLIELLRRGAGEPRGWLRGIGDDAAVLRPRRGRDLVTSVDALVEDVHFRWSTTDARSLGHKALAVNLSDLAAMGARPLGFLLSLTVPGDAGAEQLRGLSRGLLDAARAAECPLVGGDTTAGPVWMLSITALGEVRRGRALLRSGARAGDRILVTGELGGAALGLALLESGRARSAAARAHVRRQLRPVARLDAAARLAASRFVTAAIDVSDGLVQDLGHVLRASGVGGVVDVDRVPLARGLGALCARQGLDPLELALAGGEDYELLFCVSPRAPAPDVLARRLACRVSEIGVIAPGRGLRMMQGRARFQRPLRGFDHFKPSRPRSDK